MKSKKIIAALLSVLFSVCIFAGCSGNGENNAVQPDNSEASTDASNPMSEQSIPVYVTVSKGQLEAAYKEVTVKDCDSDGKFTVNDTLICVHEQFFPEGKSGFATEETQYGLSVTRLWGVDGFGIGYTLNDSTASGLTAEVKENDYVCAYVYTDSVGFSDAYSYFDTKSTTATEGEALTLTLMSSSYDESFNPVVAPLEGASVTVDGEKTEYITDKEGKVTLTLTKGEHIISATCENAVIVPPVCIANVTE